MIDYIIFFLAFDNFNTLIPCHTSSSELTLESGMSHYIRTRARIYDATLQSDRVSQIGQRVEWISIPLLERFALEGGRFKDNLQEKIYFFLGT